MPNNALSLKVPPLLLMLAFLPFMWCCTLFTPSINQLLFLRAAGAAGLILAGVLFCAAGIISFKLAKTTVNPIRPETTTELVTYGAYSISRNPMYVGFLGILIGWSFQLGNVFSLVFPALFFFYITRFQIEPEEEALALLFNEAFTEYKNRVPRWLWI